MNDARRRVLVGVLAYVLLVVGFLGVIGGLAAQNAAAVLIGAFTVYWGLRFMRLTGKLPTSDDGASG